MRFGKFEALKGISLKIPGGATGLLGPNGAGKSTLIKTLLGLIKPTTGQAEVLGLNVKTARRQVRRRVGYLPEREAYFADRNAVLTLTVLGELAGMKFSDARSRAHEVLYYVGLGEARYRRVQTYSIGMKQRMKLASALIHDPSLVFLDEPTNGMDPSGRDDMLELIRDVSRNKGIHVVVSSHLLPDVESCCDQVIVMNLGEVLRQGTIEELRGEAGQTYLVRVKGDRSVFASHFTERGRAVTDRDPRTFRIALPPSSSTREIFEAAVACGVQIRFLEPEMRTLEDVFLNALEGADAGL